MASNLTIESPNIEKIKKEAGQFTSDAITTLWAALNDTRKVERADFRMAADMIQPRVLTYSPSVSVDNLDLQGCSVVNFTGSSSVNFTGMRAPETGATRVVIIQVAGTGTITAKHEATSETQNRLVNKSGADVTLATNGATIYCYLAGRWRQIA